MSTVYVDSVQNRSSQQILPPAGAIIQAKWGRWDTRVRFAQGSRTRVGNTNSFMDLTLTDVRPGSWVLGWWQVSGESNGDVGLYCTRNGSFIDFTAGQSGQQVLGTGGNDAYWKILTMMFYDGNQDSTGITDTFRYFGPIGLTGDVTYALHVSNTGGSDSQDFAWNRTWSSAGQNSYENGVSTAVLFEVSNTLGGEGW